MKYKLNEYIAMSDSGVIFNMQTGESFTVNEIGKVIIEKVRKNYSKEQITEYILAEFEIDKETTEEHLEEFLRYMIRQQLIVPMPGE